MFVNKGIINDAALGKLVLDSLFGNQTPNSSAKDTTQPFDVQAEFQKLKDAFVSSRAAEIAKDNSLDSVAGIMARLVEGADILRQGLKPQSQAQTEPEVEETVGSRVFDSMVNGPTPSPLEEDRDPNCIVDDDGRTGEDEMDNGSKLDVAIEMLRNIIDEEATTVSTHSVLLGLLKLIDDALSYEIEINR